MDKTSSQAVASPPPATLTPMMAQFFEIKAVNPGYLLFYRMGDFYELFFEDAEIASAALGIVLTKRGKHLGEDIHMCGVPIHAANDYLNKLVKLGHRVAICEQMEDPKEAKKRGAKSVVRRDVVRLITAGTLTEDDHLDARSSNFLAALSMVRHGDTDFALAWADVSTGETFTADLTAEQLQDEMARINPAEFLLTEATRLTLVDRHLFAPGWADIAHAAPPESFDSEAATATLREAFPDDTFDPSILSRASRSALGAILAYVRESQKGVGVALRAPKAETTSKYLAIDQATRSSLELHQTQRGQARGSLRHVIDLTVTAPGSRLLSARLAAPLADAGQINERLDAVQLLANDTMLTGRLRTDLKAVPDLARALTRLALDRGGPRDLVAIGKAISAAAALSAHIADLADAPAVLVRLARTLAAAPLPLASHLALALDDEVPLLSRDGGFVRKGYDQTLDDERALASQTRDVVAALQARLIEETDVRSLKIRHNGVLGYFVEVPAAHGTKLLEDPHRDIFIHRQTMANAMRFTTTELADLEGRIAKAHEAALDIERKVFASLRYDVLNHTDVLRGLADAIAEADVTTALAHLAATRRYTRPDIDNSLAFDIVGGRHPVVEDMVMAEGQSFVANDADLSGDDASGGGRLWLVTGPNMGGKSTFLRQNALIAILAQMGSFVPASSAHIGVIDRVFSRVGASDDIAHGRSTFMVEMVETAAILNRATRRSLVVLDEIGRGTATFDGLSIAWAAVEALHETTGCRALFATHFHELTSLAKTLSRVSNVTMKVREWEGEVVFLHEVGSGAADRSYGIQVARLAGLPEPVLARARQVLTVLEQRSAGTASSSQKATVLDDLPLFAHHVAPAPVQKDPVLTALDAVRPDEMTPKQAIEALYELKKIRDDARRS
ncbi:DNA mismatch repair protein MutS [Devosia sp. BSSL-BM10]|uniref:DNA mismatch repair protein MutS n=1 Tax=Devosia litorisediminis TaxID=2829817 RepID=A0A942I6K3_9HYPH|nr:DNA mismatch repair protein MutS [Devosia litorisediminis]MBS3850431.1 DNA mismatch repair protein MutS [Devosia litorisediminis]